MSKRLEFLAPDGSLYWDALDLTLTIGTEGPGVFLSASECVALVEVVRGALKWPRRKRGAPPNPNTVKRERCIAFHTLVIEGINPANTEAAVKEACAFFGVSRTTVFKCRAKWLSDLKAGRVIANVPERQRQRLLEWMRDSQPKSRN